MVAVCHNHPSADLATEMMFPKTILYLWTPPGHTDWSILHNNRLCISILWGNRFYRWWVSSRRWVYFCRFFIKNNNITWHGYGRFIRKLRHYDHPTMIYCCWEKIRWRLDGLYCPQGGSNVGCRRGRHNCTSSLFGMVLRRRYEYNNTSKWSISFHIMSMFIIYPNRLIKLSISSQLRRLLKWGVYLSPPRTHVTYAIVT